MKNKVKVHVLWLPLALLAAGCFDTRQIEQDFQRNRQASYNRLTRTQLAAEIPGEKPKADSTADMKILEGALTLEQCQDIALTYNKDVQIAKKKLLESDGQMTEAISTALPKASLNGEQMWKDQEIQFSFSDLFGGNSGGGDDGSTIEIPPTTYSQEARQIQLLVRQPLYLGGLTEAALDAAKVYTYQNQQQLRQSVQQVRFSIEKNYLAAMLARELAEVARKSRDNAASLLEDTRKKFNAGAASRFEVLRAEVQLQTAQAEQIRLANDYDLAINQLLNALGVSQMSRIELAGALDYRKQTVPRQEVMELAMVQRPDLLVGESMIRLMEDNVKSEQSGDRPNVYLQGSYQRSYPGSGEQFGGRDWDMYANAGLVVEWAFFDGFRTRGRVIQAKSKLQQQRLQLEKLEQQVQLDISQSLRSIDSAEKFVEAQGGSVQNAQEALRLAQVSYREGAATALDVITAQTALAQVRSSYCSAVHGYQLALLGLELNSGTLGEKRLFEGIEHREQ